MQKTYYQLGTGGTMFIIANLMILAAAVYTQANLLFWAFGLTTGAFIVSLCFATISLSHIHVERLTPSQGVTGRSLTLRYRIENGGRLPIWGLLIEETWIPRRRWYQRKRRIVSDATEPSRRKTPMIERPPLGWILHIGPKQTGQGEARCWPLHRGKLAFDRMVLSTSFPFGVIRKLIEIRQIDEVVIYPPLYRINRKVLVRAAGMEANSRQQMERAGGHDEFFGLRLYRTGDSLKMIDWKHSAKTTQLVTREMTQPTTPRIMLAVDLREETLMAAARAAERMEAPRQGAGRTGLMWFRNRPVVQLDEQNFIKQADPFELAICLAASLVCDSYLQGYEIGMIVWGVNCRTFRMHHSLPHRTKILDALSALNHEDKTIREQQHSKVITEPTVIVRPGGSINRGRHMHGRIVLGTDDMAHYVKKLDGDIEALLANRPMI